MARTSDKLTFVNDRGQSLAARLDRPTGVPKAFALFAHCFTCSKDTLAASRIATELTSHGFAVLRFDFTGLGGSEGEFGNTSFSSNLEDLDAAIAYLRSHHQAPQLLVGHSLGGAAMLAIAGRVPEVKAVATIGAPADVAHVAHLFDASRDEIAEKGKAEVELAGRRFTVSKGFIDDLSTHRLSDLVAAMRKPLLVLHAPLDQIVGIENATAIFAAARHPKSFVSLDGADHLLTRRQDAAFAASVLAAWASRYLDADLPSAGLPEAGPAGVASVAETRRGTFEQEVRVGAHKLFADEPTDFGGFDSGPSPYDFLSVALGACTSMTLRLYADRKQLALDSVRVDVTHAKVHANDCADCGEGRVGQIDRFERSITLTGTLSADERKRLLEIADKCPVHRTLAASSVIATRLAG